MAGGGASIAGWVGRSAATWVRRELATAFAAGTTVIPVLVGDVPRISADDLPPSIARLARCQAMRLRHRDCGQDLDRVVTVVSQLVTGDGRLGA